jgi:hypothetical protein
MFPLANKIYNSFNTTVRKQSFFVKMYDPIVIIQTVDLKLRSVDNILKIYFLHAF